MRICVLQAAYTTTVENYVVDPSPWLPEHACEHHYIHKATAAREVLALVRRGEFDLFFNLCDGCGDSDEAGIEVTQTLERLGVPFTGADTVFWEQHREVFKLAAHARDVATPNYVFAADAAAAELAGERLRFPLIVKHPSSYASIGLTRDSRVADVPALRREVARFLDCFGAALIEEFIEGREFTVLVAENPDDPEDPIAFTPLEILFPPGEAFKHYDLKWIDYGRIHGAPVDDPALAARLADMTRTLFLALDGCSYARCDIRMDRGGRLHALELNSNPAIFYAPHEAGSADLILRHDPRGPRGFLDLVLRAAFVRHRRRARRWSLHALPGDGVGLHATADLAAGDLIIPGEGGEFRLTTRARAGALDGQAAPLPGDLVALRGATPRPWRSLRPSSDPNTELHGLDIVARRPIRRGELLTLDPAVFADLQARA